MPKGCLDSTQDASGQLQLKLISCKYWLCLCGSYTRVVHSSRQAFWGGCPELSVPAIHLKQSCVCKLFLKAFQGGHLFSRKLLPVCHSPHHQESFPSDV